MSRPAALVYLSTAAAEQAARLFPKGVVPEIVVTNAITAGAVRIAGGKAEIDGGEWVARAIRIPGRVRPTPRAWLVLGVEKAGAARRRRRRQHTAIGGGRT